MENADEETLDNEARPPTEAEIVSVCRRLNEVGAKYIVVGGVAIQQAGYPRPTMDLDLIIDIDPSNEALVLAVIAELPEHAATELKVGDVAEYTVVRVADTFTVDLMKSACGLSYHELREDAVVRELGGVFIPFASPKKLWLMKQTYREKDAVDRLFLRQLLGDDLPPTPVRAPL